MNLLSEGEGFLRNCGAASQGVLQSNLTYQLVWLPQSVSRAEETLETHYGGQITFSTQLIKTNLTYC